MKDSDELKVTNKILEELKKQMMKEVKEISLMEVVFYKTGIVINEI